MSRRPVPDAESDTRTPSFLRGWQRAVALWSVVVVVNLVGDSLIYFFFVQGPQATVCAVTSTIPFAPHLQGTDAIPAWWDAFKVLIPCQIAVRSGNVLSPFDFQVAATLAALATTVCAGPLIWFLMHTWFARYDEFRNSLKDGALRAYLERFWARRLISELAARKLIARASAEENDDRSSSWREAAEAHPLVCQYVFKSIYHTHYGLSAFLTPFALLVTITFAAACLVARMRGCMASGTACPDELFGREAPVAISATAGAFLFAVGDSVRCIRQRCMTVSDSYWYALRLLIAIPMGLAFARAADPTVLQTAMAFALATFPLNDFLKVIRRFAFPQISDKDSAEDGDKLLELAGVTLPIAAIFAAEGIYSTEQLAATDPVVLSVRTGLPFRFVLSLGSQAMVRRHLGPQAGKLADLGLNNALSVLEVVRALDAPAGTAGLMVKAPQAIMQSAVKQLGGVEGAALDISVIEMKFREIAAEEYTLFLDHIAPPEPQGSLVPMPVLPRTSVAPAGV